MQAARSRRAASLVRSPKVSCNTHTHTHQVSLASRRCSARHGLSNFKLLPVSETAACATCKPKHENNLARRYNTANIRKVTSYILQELPAAKAIGELHLGFSSLFGRMLPTYTHNNSNCCPRAPSITGHFLRPKGLRNQAKPHRQGLGTPRCHLPTPELDAIVTQTLLLLQMSIHFNSPYSNL